MPGAEVAVQRRSQDTSEVVPPRSRPVSFYDNFKVVAAMPSATRVTSAASVGDFSEIGRTSMATTLKDNARSTGNLGKLPTRFDEREKELGRAPSMATCLSTTVPVNLAAAQIAGRHTPTRNSLRHSRMIVQHRTGYRSQKSSAGMFRNRRLAECLAVLQTILGLAVIFLSVWLFLWAPNLPIIDNPYWSGLPLLLSGTLGMCLLRCFKEEYTGGTAAAPNFSSSSIKVTSALLSTAATAATAACLIGALAGAVHLARLTGLECAPARLLNATCLCRPRDEATSPLVGSIRYADLNCPEVEDVLTVLLVFSSSCNGIGSILAGCFGYLHWSTRRPGHPAHYQPVLPKYDR